MRRDCETIDEYFLRIVDSVNVISLEEAKQSGLPYLICKHIDGNCVIVQAKDKCILSNEDLSMAAREILRIEQEAMRELIALRLGVM